MNANMKKILFLLLIPIICFADGRGSFRDNFTSGGTWTGGTVPDSVIASGGISTTNMSVSGDIRISQKLIHDGDEDTYLDLTTDAAGLYVGNEKFINVIEDGTQDIIELGDDGDIDIKLSGGSDGALFVQGSSGNVGIGTATPISPLEVEAGLTTTGAVFSLGTKETTVVDGDKLGQIDFYAPLEADGTDAILPGASIWAEADSTFEADDNATTLVLGTGSSEAATGKVYVKSNGNVGIGTTGPLCKLDVYSTDTVGQLNVRGYSTIGGAHNSNGLLAIGGGGVNTQGQIDYDYLGGQTALRLVNKYSNVAAVVALRVNGVDRLTVLGSGNVGIGTTGPNQKLTVEGTMSLKEQASANTDVAAYGQLWTKNTTPNELWFTDDAGTDVQLGAAADTIIVGALSKRNGTPTTIDVGSVTWTKFDMWSGSDGFIGASYDGTKKGILVNEAGLYEVSFSASIEATGTGVNQYVFAIGTETTRRDVGNARIDLDATTSDYQVISFTTMASFGADSTICVWGINATDGDDFIVNGGSLFIKRITYSR